MKICPTCNQTYTDDMLNYCLNDGAVLISKSENPTAEMRSSGRPTDIDSPGRFTDFKLNESEQNHTKPKKKGISTNILLVSLILGVLAFVCGGAGVGIYLLSSSHNIFSQNDDRDIYVQNTNSGRTDVENSNTSVTQTTNNDKSLTIEKFTSIKPKSSYKEVVGILGSEGEQISSSGSGAYSVETYKWSGGDTEFIILVFMNDKLTSKTQAGLSEKISDSLTLEKFNQVKNGMKYEEVAEILGEGSLQSSMTILNMTVENYHWKADDFSFVSLGFQNGKLNSKTQSGLK